jgi:hypothetical protein
MLSEKEFQHVTSLRQRGGDPRAAFDPVLAEYERITGYKETNPDAIYHHRFSLYGLPADSAKNRCGPRKQSFAGTV